MTLHVHLASSWLPPRNSHLSVRTQSTSKQLLYSGSYTSRNDATVTLCFMHLPGESM